MLVTKPDYDTYRDAVISLWEYFHHATAVSKVERYRHFSQEEETCESPLLSLPPACF